MRLHPSERLLLLALWLWWEMPEVLASCRAIRSSSQPHAVLSLLLKPHPEPQPWGRAAKEKEKLLLSQSLPFGAGSRVLGVFSLLLSAAEANVITALPAPGLWASSSGGHILTWHPALHALHRQWLTPATALQAHRASHVC